MRINRNEARRRLKQFQMDGDSNWRFKGLLLAAFGDAEAVGEAWPTSDRFLADGHKRSAYRAMHSPGEGITNTVVPSQRQGVELSHAREEFSKKELDSEQPRDKYFKRMLLRGAEEELDTLWREELLTTVIEAAQKKEVARRAAQVIPVESKKGDHPRGSSAGFAQELSEGGRIEDDMEDYDTVAFDCTKYGAGFSVTEEMVDHAQISAIERQVGFAGKRIENSLNQSFITQIVDNAGNEVDTDQATPTWDEVQGVNHAVGEVEVADFPEPDYLVVHPEFKTLYFDEANIAQANYAGSDSALRQRVFDPIFGMEMLTASDGMMASGATQTWGWDADGEIGGVATSSEFVGIFMYKDISTKDFEDPIRDIRGGNARAWFDVKLLQPNAHCRMEY